MHAKFNFVMLELLHKLFPISSASSGPISLSKYIFHIKKNKKINIRSKFRSVSTKFLLSNHAIAPAPDDPIALSI